MAVSAKKAAPFEECSVDRTEILQSEESKYSHKQMKLWLKQQDSSDEEDSPRDRLQSEESRSSFKQMISWLDRGDSVSEKGVQEGVDGVVQLVTASSTLKTSVTRDESRLRIPHGHSTTANEEIETGYCHNSSSHIHGGKKGAATPLGSQRKKEMVTKRFEVRDMTKAQQTHHLQKLQQRGRNKKRDWRKQTASYSPRRDRAWYNKRKHECKKPGDKMHRTLLRKYLSLSDLFTQRLFAEDLDGVEANFTNVDMETKEVSPLGKLGQRRNRPCVGVLDSPPINGREDVGKSPGFNITAEAVGLQKTNKEISPMPSPVHLYCAQQDPLRLPNEPSDIINDMRTQFKTCKEKHLANKSSEELSQRVDVAPLPYREMPMAKSDEFKLGMHEQASRVLEFCGSSNGYPTKRTARKNNEQYKKAPSFMKTFRTRPALYYEVEVWQNGENESTISRLDLLHTTAIQTPRSGSSHSLGNVNPSHGIERFQRQSTPPKLKEDKGFNTDITMPELEIAILPPPPRIKTTCHVKLPHNLPDVPSEILAPECRKYSQLSLDTVMYRFNTEEPLINCRCFSWPILNIDENSIYRSRSGAVGKDGKWLGGEDSSKSSKLPRLILSPTTLDDDNSTFSTFESSITSSVYDIFDEIDTVSNHSILSTDAPLLELPANDVDRIYLQEHIKLYEAMQSVSYLYFGKLPVRKQAKLMRQLKPERYRRNEYIIKKGDLSGSFYFITGPRPEMLDHELAGVSVVVDDMDEQVICHLYVGSHFGERALICSNEEKRSETVKVTSSYVDVVRVGKENFADWKEFRTYAILKDITWLSGLPSATLHAVQECLQRMDFTDGSHIVEKGDIGIAFYIISTGTVEVVDIEDNGREIPLVQLYEGQAFGDLALLYGEPRNATVKAKGPVSCLVLGKSDFRGCLDKEGFMDVLEREAHSRQIYIERRKKVREAIESDNSARSLDHSGILNSYLVKGSSSEGEPIFGVATPQPSPHHEPITTSCLNRQRLRDGKKIINKYEILRELGKGTYGTVMLARHLDTQKMYAMKILNKGRKNSKVKCQLPKTLRHEVAVMKRLRHPNIVTLWEVIDDPNAHQLYLIQDYMDGGGVLPEGCPVPPLEIMTARLQLVDCIRGLHYLHSNRIIHGDIKPANLLTDSRGSVKIADFGAARIIRKEEQTGIPPGGELPNNPTMINLIGTPTFMAPELFGEDAINCVGPETDVWALGVTLFQMIYGKLPFWYKGCSQKVLEMRIRCHALDFPQDEVEPPGVRPGVSRKTSIMDDSFEGLGDPLWPSLRNLLKRFLDKDPKSRICLDEVISHPWVTVEGSWPQEPLQQESCNYANITQREIQNAWLQVSPQPNEMLQMAATPRIKNPSFFGESPLNELRPPRLGREESLSSTFSNTFDILQVAATPRTKSSTFFGEAPLNELHSLRLCAKRSLSLTFSNTFDMFGRNILSECNTPSSSETPRLLRKHRKNSSLHSSNATTISQLSSQSSTTSPAHYAESSLPPLPPQYTSDSVIDGANLEEGPKKPSESLINWPSESATTPRQSLQEKGVIGMGGAENDSSHHLGLTKCTLKCEYPPCKGTSYPVEELKQSSKAHQISSSSTPQTRSINHCASKSATNLSSVVSILGFGPETSNSNCRVPNTLSSPNLFCMATTGHDSSSSSICGPITERFLSKQFSSLAAPSLDGSNIKCEGDGHFHHPGCHYWFYNMCMSKPISNMVHYRHKTVGLPIWRSTDTRYTRHMSLSAVDWRFKIEKNCWEEEDCKEKREGKCCTSSEKTKTAELAINPEQHPPSLLWKSVFFLMPNGTTSEHNDNSACNNQTPASEHADFPERQTSSLTPRSREQQQSISVHKQQQQKGASQYFPITRNSFSSFKSYLEEGVESDGIALHRDDNYFHVGRKNHSTITTVDKPRLFNAASAQTMHSSIGEEDSDSIFSEDIHAVACDDIDQVIFNSKPIAYSDPSLLPVHPSEFQSLDIVKPVQSKTFCYQSNDLLGIRFGRGCEQGNREHMEDCYVAIGDLLSLKVDPSIQPEVVEAIEEEQAILLDSGQLEAAAFFAVYDGHNGVYVAKALQKSLHHCLLVQPSFPSDMGTAIENACKAVDEACLIAEALQMQSNFNRIKHGGESSIQDVEKTNNMSRKLCLQTVKDVHENCSKEQEKLGGAASFAGSTAIIAVLCRSPDIDESVYLWIASVGDCRAVLCRNNVAVGLSLDHTPMRESEAKRIIAANGFINRERLNGMLGALCGC